jgi:NAD-dependent SIR2 family protein deacetylase
MTDDNGLQRAAEAIADADALLIGAGAGMGVDSGLPDFRGDRGFWNAYPAYERLGMNFMDLANPAWFARDPGLGWGFYGHRLNLYRATNPHEGFDILRKWAARKRQGAFVFTSNVDGHFQRAGFEADRVVEVHGAIDWLQCTRNCGQGVFAVAAEVVVNEATMRAREPLPACPSCGGLARPNILMFGDWDWDGNRTAAQEACLHRWLESLGDARLAVVECGAGTAIPTVRRFSEALIASAGATLIRINVREPSVPAGQIGLALGAREALNRLRKLLDRHGEPAG